MGSPDTAVFFVFISSLIPLAICMAVGFACNKTGIVDDKSSPTLSAFLMKVALPCTVYSSLVQSEFSTTLLMESVFTFFLSGASFALGILAGVVLAKLARVDKNQSTIWVFVLVFANTGYMGFPVIEALYGNEGMIYASMANASFQIMLFTYGVWLFNKGNGIKAAKQPFWVYLAKNPALIATVLGLACFVTRIHLPDAVNQGIRLIGGATTPLSMVLVGAMLAKSPMRRIFTDYKAIPVILMRLLGIPLVTFLVLRIFVDNPVMLGVIVTLSAMPAAAVTVVFAEEYKGDVPCATRLVTLTTIVCIATVPLISFILE